MVCNKYTNTRNDLTSHRTIVYSRVNLKFSLLAMIYAYGIFLIYFCILEFYISPCVIRALDLTVRDADIFIFLFHYAAFSIYFLYLMLLIKITNF